MIRKIRSMAVVSVITGAMVLSAADAAIIKYNFDDNDAVVDTNELAGDGVTAGNIVSEGVGGIDENRWQRKLLGGSTANMSFTISIPSDVTIDLTELSFIDGIDSGTGANDTYSGWDLTVSTGSASPDSGTEFVAGTGYSESENTVTLSGLTGLTDTSVTFDFLVNYATDPEFTGGNNNNRHAFLDDVTLTSTVIPEPSTVILAGLGLLGAVLRQRRPRV